MTSFSQNINKYCIPSPCFNFGDLVEHTFHFSPSESWELVGTVSARIYNEDEADGVGYWEYMIDGNISLSTFSTFCQWGEVVREDELKAYTTQIPAVHAIVI